MHKTKENTPRAANSKGAETKIQVQASLLEAFTLCQPTGNEEIDGDAVGGRWLDYRYLTDQLDHPDRIAALQSLTARATNAYELEAVLRAWLALTLDSMDLEEAAATFVNAVTHNTHNV